MTDHRNGDGVPPPSAPVPPPPLASDPPAQPTPPPAQPAQQLHYTPVAPPAYPAAPNSKTGLWAFLIILAFAVGVGGTILTLWLTGELWNSSSSYAPTSYGSSTSTSGGTGASSGMTPPAPAPAPAPTTTGGYAPTADSLQGTWGPGCPGSRSQALTFYGDGTAESDGESGSWSLSGNEVTLTNERETMTLYWEMLSNDMARVRRSAGGNTRTINRCP